MYGATDVASRYRVGDGGGLPVRRLAAPAPRSIMSMRRLRSLSQALLAVTSLTLLVAPRPASAQRTVAGGEVTVAPPPGPSLPPKTAKVAVLPCCMCLGRVSPLNLGTGVAPWMVRAPGTKALVPATSIKAPHPAWAQPATGGPLTWIDDKGDGGSADKAVGRWTYTLKVQVPTDCIIPFAKPIKLTGNVAADDAFKLYVNGSAALASGGYQSTVAWSATLTPGLNIIRVEVDNATGPTGLAVVASLEAPCAKGPTTKGPVKPAIAVDSPKGINEAGIP